MLVDSAACVVMAVVLKVSARNRGFNVFIGFLLILKGYVVLPFVINEVNR